MPKKARWNEVRCPKCREPMAVSASRCPHCTTEFDADAVTKRQREHWIGLAGGCLLLLAGIFMLSWCSDRKDQAQRAGEAPATSAKSDAQKEAVDDSSDQPLPTIAAVALPQGAPEAPAKAFCLNNRACDVARLTFGRNDWPKAWKGDYQGQRNVAFCLKTGCDGGVEINPIAACAWRSIILSSGSAKVDPSDTANFNADCKSLDDTARTASDAQAGSMFRKIYGRSIDER